MILSHPMLQQYPLKTPYLIRFLKTIINQVRKKEIAMKTVYDDLF